MFVLPAAAVTALPTSGLAPLNVAFDGSASSDADDSIISCAWNFGDGATASGVTANHIYTSARSYVARLTVTDIIGATNLTTTTVQLTANLPIAPSNLTATPISRSQINLTWSENAINETGFKIERCTGATCSNFAQIGSVGANVKNFSSTDLKQRNTLPITTACGPVAARGIQPIQPSSALSPPAENLAEILLKITRISAGVGEYKTRRRPRIFRSLGMIRKKFPA